MSTNICEKNLWKNDFYVLDTLSPHEISLDAGVYAIILLENLSGDYHFHLQEEAHVEVYGYFDYQNASIFIHHDAPKTQSVLHVLVHTATDPLKCVFASTIHAPHARSQIEIVNIISSSVSDVDASITIKPEGIKAKASLKQKNIFLLHSGKVTSTPKLLVETNEVEASHSCGVERIAPDHLCYLMARGLPESLATSLLISWHFQRLFSCLKMMDASCYEALKEKFLGKFRK